MERYPVDPGTQRQLSLGQRVFGLGLGFGARVKGLKLEGLGLPSCLLAGEPLMLYLEPQNLTPPRTWTEFPLKPPETLTLNPKP